MKHSKNNLNVCIIIINNESEASEWEWERMIARKILSPMTKDKVFNDKGMFTLEALIVLHTDCTVSLNSDGS